MVIWWTKIMAAAGCVGVIIFCLVMEAAINDAHNPFAIFWFFVAIGATLAFFGVYRMQPQQAVQSTHWVVYHGTPTWNNAAGAIQTGFIPGPGGTYGQAVYTAFDFAVAATYARGGGYVFQLHINNQTPFADYDQIPGQTIEEKRLHCLTHGWGLVFVKKYQLFICFGYTGVPVAIPGLEKVEVFDEFGNPVTIQ